MTRLSKSGLGMALGLTLLGAIPQTNEKANADDGTSAMNANNMYSLMQTSSQIAINNNSNLNNEYHYQDMGFKDAMCILGGSTLATLAIFGFIGYRLRRKESYDYD